MNEQARACAAYFQSRPGYSRILSELLKKYRSYGRPAGTIRLDGATQSEASRLLLQGCAGTDLEASAEAVK